MARACGDLAIVGAAFEETTAMPPVVARTHRVRTVWVLLAALVTAGVANACTSRDTGKSSPATESPSIQTPAGNPARPEQLLVTVTDPATADQQAREVAATINATVTRRIDGATYLLEVPAPDAAALEDARQRLTADSRVRSSEYNLVLDVSPQRWPATTPRFPDDTLYQEKTDWSAPPDRAGARAWPLVMIRAPQAWATATGSDVNVLVLDWGLLKDHEDLTGNFREVFNADQFISGSPEKPKAKMFHGTSTASAACAVGNNELGMAGVAWRCNLYGFEMGKSVDIATIRATFAEMRRDQRTPRVANMSFGGPSKNNRQRRETEVAWRDVFNTNPDVLFVLSAGNDGNDTRKSLPAALGADVDNVITVAGINKLGAASKFSNLGEATKIAAPAEQVLVATSKNADNANGAWYTRASGTSFAAPLVTGVASLLFTANPRLSASGAKECLITSATRPVTGIPGRSKGIDLKIVDAAAALQKCGTAGSTVADLQRALAADQSICPDSELQKDLATEEMMRPAPGPFTVEVDLDGDGIKDVVGVTQCRAPGYEWSFPVVALLSSGGLVNIDPDPAVVAYFPTALRVRNNSVEVERLLPAGQPSVGWTYVPPTSEEGVASLFALRYTRSGGGFSRCHAYANADDSEIDRCPDYTLERRGS